MPRSIYPRNLNPKLRAASPVEVMRSQVITDWTNAWETEGIVSGLISRIVARAPFDGYLSDAVFVPDVAQAAIPSNFWSIYIKNAEVGGQGPWAMTAQPFGAQAFTPLVPVQMQQNLEPIPSPNPLETYPIGDWVQVLKGDLIALTIYRDGTGSYESLDPPPCLTGTVFVWFTQTGGS